jgi:predicted nucleic acid-binding protein
MKLALDASVLIAAFSAPKVDTEESRRRQQDALDLLDALGKPHEFLLPTVAATEFLCGVAPARQSTMESLLLSRFELCTFDFRAARFAAVLHRHATRSRSEGRQETRQVAKVDALILASAVAAGCQGICQSDRDYGPLIRYGQQHRVIPVGFRHGSPADFVPAPSLGLR